MKLKPPTYPARPIDGGPFTGAPDKIGEWRTEPKYNGWRALVHIASGSMFNRQLEPLSIQNEFTTALAQLRAVFSNSLVQWADCEALERRHAIGRGTLILLDLVMPHATYAERRAAFGAMGITCRGIGETIKPDSLYVSPSYRDAQKTWNLALAECNRESAADFYEGIVMKRVDAFYPMQIRSPHFETPCWVKHRWKF
ncbi:MAG: hypothetical protein WA183_13220 [Chthoniobacterales bacterium]